MTKETRDNEEYKQLTKADKLRLLAEWLDLQHGVEYEPDEVQQDLRHWADEAERVPVTIQLVKIYPEGDGAAALYIDGTKYISGDSYHNKIDGWIEGFLAGLWYIHEIPEAECWYILSESGIPEAELEDLICCQPETFNELPKKWLTQIWA
jgi:hypothetical protein